MLKEKETRALVDFTNKFFGLDISEDLKPIALSELNKFKKTNKISNLEEFLNNFQYDFQNEKILSLLDIFLIPHTSFFRNNRQFEVLKNEVIPKCIEHENEGNHIDLRIWSAGCSTGEEAYSILVSLMEYFGEEYWNITCGVLATDISKKSLSIASKAIYQTKKIDKLSLERILGFTEALQNGKLCFTEKIRKEANFQQLNLNSKTFPFKNRFHIIFCRNVLIYFNQKSRIAAENKILQSLENGGYIFLGDAEVFTSRDYELEQLGNGVYRKRL